MLMRTWHRAIVMLAAPLVCLALGGCGSGGFGWGVSCSSATECAVVLQSPAGNGDPLTWTVTSSDARVRIVPSHGAIAPGQTITVKVTLPAGACGTPLTGTARDAVWPLGASFGFGAAVPNMPPTVACGGAPTVQ
jgi:hypothetical protein